jgi:hypothetical protein
MVVLRQDRRVAMGWRSIPHPSAKDAYGWGTRCGLWVRRKLAR